jgi:hypothetical protein
MPCIRFRSGPLGVVVTRQFLHRDGEKPTDPERSILIEVIQEPAIGKQYRVTGKGLDPAHQTSVDFTDGTLEEARKRALELAEAVNMPIIYLSSGIAQTET